MESKTVHKKEVGDGGKKCKILKEVQSIEKMNKNPQSFLEISLLQKEVSSHKLQGHEVRHRLIKNC